jgi:hypothetical protein
MNDATRSAMCQRCGQQFPAASFRPPVLSRDGPTPPGRRDRGRQWRGRGVGRRRTRSYRRLHLLPTCPRGASMEPQSPVLLQPRCCRMHHVRWGTPSNPAERGPAAPVAPCKPPEGGGLDRRPPPPTPHLQAGGSVRVLANVAIRRVNGRTTSRWSSRFPGVRTPLTASGWPAAHFVLSNACSYPGGHLLDNNPAGGGLTAILNLINQILGGL